MLQFLKVYLNLYALEYFYYIIANKRRDNKEIMHLFLIIINLYITVYFCVSDWGLMVLCDYVLIDIHSKFVSKALTATELDEMVLVLFIVIFFQNGNWVFRKKAEIVVFILLSIFTTLFPMLDVFKRK